MNRRSKPAAPLGLTPRTARELAYRVLRQHFESGAWVQEELAEQWTRSHWSPADRRFVTELVCGVVRRQAALTTLLRAFITRPWDRIETELVTLLWLGAYQLVYLDRVPAFAAIDETVEVARMLGQARWTGFANGVLRGLHRSLTDEFQDQPATDAIPVGPGRYRKMRKPVLPDPKRDWPVYLAQAHSIPAWLVDRWIRNFDRETLLNLATEINRSPRMIVRVNRRKCSLDELQQRWSEAGITSAKIAGHPFALQLADAGPIDELPGFNEGLFSPQDLTAMRAAPRLAPSPADRVWDMCAAPGTKTCHLAELRDDQGSILATDVHPDRLSLVTTGAARLGLTSITPRLIADDLSDGPAGPFDAILVDAPCSNTGVLHRRPEARWRIRPEDCVELPQIQKRLLMAAAQRLAPSGRLLYSTCSIEREENSEVVVAVMESCPGLQLDCEFFTLPGAQGDGGYQALLVAGPAGAGS